MTALALAPNGVHKPTLSKVFEELWGNDFLMGSSTKHPATNIREFDEHFLIELTVPGYEKSDLNMQVQQNQLVISASIENEKESEENGAFKLREFSASSFTRTFRLPNTIQVDKISAKYKDGILAIHLPKKDEAKNHPPRSIQIK